MPDLRFAAIGTSWTIETPLALGFIEALVHDRIESFDQTWSRFRADSVVTAAATTAGTYDFADDAPRLFDLYDRLVGITDGAVTPLVGRALEWLGYDRQYSFTQRSLSINEAAGPSADWMTSVQRTGSLVSVIEPTLIDVGAAGKGFLVDLIGELLHENDVHEFVIDAGGDILVSMPTAQRIALEHPLDPSLAIGVAELTSGSICASGSNRRVWGEGIHHILDGRTGLPTVGVIATWATAESALVADGLATALFFTEPARLAREFDFEWVTVFTGGATARSGGFPGELFS